MAHRVSWSDAAVCLELGVKPTCRLSARDCGDSALNVPLRRGFARDRNSGESGYVGNQDKSGASAHPPGRPETDQTTGSTTGGKSR